MVKNSELGVAWFVVKMTDMIFLWFIILFSGNTYINTAVNGLMEIPCYIVCMISLHFFGRRIPLAVMFLSSAIILLITTGKLSLGRLHCFSD